jgi:light-regulated signal transduction histidine kinase (bacteriophytochrome)
MARGRGSGSDGSTGLGLDIVRRLAESTGGDVRIGSSVPPSTEVRVWIQLDGRTPASGGHRQLRRRRPGRFAAVYSRSRSH